MNDLPGVNIPLLSNVLRRQNETRPSNPTPIKDNIIKKNAQFIREHPELLDKFADISKELIIMGYSANLINNLFLVKRFQSLEEAVDLLSLNKGKWNHEYLEGDKFICFICENPEHEHVASKPLFQPNLNANEIKILQKQKGRVSIEKIKKSEEEIVLKINVNECPICFAELGGDQVYKLDCEHQFCRDCIVNYLEEEINCAKTELKCPWNKCELHFPEERIKELVSDTFYSKLNKFRSRKELSKDPSLLPCPIADCEGFAKRNSLTREKQSFIGRRSLSKVKYTCSNAHNFCGKCNKIWHGSESCEDDKEILHYATDSGKMLKKCVKCKVWTEKNEGCNHMHCKICEADWCWLCENLCPADHYRIPNTPCYGRQFNEYDPDFEYYELLFDQENFWKGLLFFFVFSFLVINGSIRNVMNPPANNQLQPPTKFVVFIIIFCILSFCVVFLILTNGIIASYMAINLGKLQTVRSNFSKLTCVSTFLLILIVFYPFGLTLASIWFVICLLYSIFKIIGYPAQE